MDTETLNLLIAIFVPIIILQWGLNIFALVDLIRREENLVRYLPKWGWVAVIILVNFVGAIAYLIAGREEA